MSDEPNTVYVEEPPRRLLGNLLIDGHDGQCSYVYAGIEERCQEDAAAHTWMDHGGEMVRVEMCTEHAREDVPEPPTAEQQELVTDGGRDTCTRDTERPGPEDDPFACSRCGAALGSLARVHGERCWTCRREIADMLGIPEEERDV